MLFTDSELAYLAAQRLGRLATVRLDGTVQANPVGFRHNRHLDTIDIGGRNMAASHKFRNVREGAPVALVVDDIASIDPWRVRGIEIRGHADALTDPRDSAAGFDGPIIRIHPERVISWGVDPDHRGMHGRDVAATPTGDRARR